MIYSHTIFAIDTKWNDLYLILDYNPKVKILYFKLNGGNKRYFLTDEEKLNFYVNITTNFPLYRDKNIRYIEYTPYIKLAFGEDDELDSLYLEEFRGDSFVCVRENGNIEECGILDDLDVNNYGQYAKVIRIAAKKIDTPRKRKREREKNTYIFRDYKYGHEFIHKENLIFTGIEDIKLDLINVDSQ